MTPRRRVELDRRRTVRRALEVLLQWLTVHAIAPNDGRPLTADLVADDEVRVAALLGEVADAGALRYFGIRSAVDVLGAPVTLYAVDDPRYRHGTIALHLPPLVAWMEAGGARADGWCDPAELTAEDLDGVAP